MKFEASGDALFSGVDGLAAFGALGVLNWLERHFVSLVSAYDNENFTYNKKKGAFFRIKKFKIYRIKCLKQEKIGSTIF